MDLNAFVINFVTSPNYVWWQRFFSVSLIIILTFTLATLINRLMRKAFERIQRQSQEHPEIVTDTTKFVVLRRVSQVIIYLIGFAAIVYAIPEFRALSYSILVGAGVAAVIIGFAAQKAFANIMSGIFLAVSEPIRVGDRVEIDKHSGTVEDITLRHTMIRTWENNRVILPNSLVNEAPITNYTLVDPNVIQTISIGISYDSDIDKAKKIIMEEVMGHPEFMRRYDPTGYVNHETGVSVRLIEFTDFAIRLRAYFWARDTLSGFIMEKELLEKVKKKFDKEGIEIPSRYRTVVYKKGIRKRGTIKKKDSL